MGIRKSPIPNSNSFDIDFANAMYQVSRANAILEFDSDKAAAQAEYDEVLDYQIWLWGFCNNSGCCR